MTLYVQCHDFILSLLQFEWMIKSYRVLQTLYQHNYQMSSVA